MYYQAAGSITYNVKTRQVAKSKRNENLSIEARQFKALALIPIGKKITIPSRRVVGDHPKVKEIIQNIVGSHLPSLNNIITNNLRQR